MNLRQIALDNSILELKVGSHLYGTSTPESDVDFNGVFIAPKEFYLGLQRVSEVDLSVISKHENGRNDKDAIDRKFFELRKYVKLASENNPNIVEQLFVPNNQLVECSSLGRKLLDNRHLFPYIGCYDKFIGYAISQKKKMVVKRDNMQDIIKAIDFFEKIQDKNHNYVVQYKNNILKHDFQLVKDRGQHIQIGDIHLQKNETIKQVLRKLQDRRSKFSGRYEDFISKSGYDTKFASHLIRLLYEGTELLETGEIQLPLKKSELILDIKQGKFTIEEIMEMSEDLEHNMDQIVKMSDLPKRPQIKKIENLLIEIVEEFLELK